MSTWMEGSRPVKVILGVMFCVDSDIDLEKTQILYLDVNRKENPPLEKSVF